ncbi:hypothetical protein Gotur_025086, partial [Gossypium turneri]
MGVGATGSVAPSSFHFIRKAYLMPLYCSWDCSMRS